MNSDYKGTKFESMAVSTQVWNYDHEHAHAQKIDELSKQGWILRTEIFISGSGNPPQILSRLQRPIEEPRGTAPA